MNAAQAKRLTIASLTAAGVLAAVSDIAEEDRIPRLRILLGATGAGVILTLMADFLSPDLAAGFAILILVAAIFVTGDDVWRKLAGVITADR